MISNRCARKSLVTNCNSIISKNYLRFLVDSNDVKYLIEKGKADPFVKVNNISPVEQAVIQDQLEIVDYLISSSNVSLHIPSGTYGGGRTVYDILVKKHYPSDSDLYTLQQRILQLQTTVPE